MEDVKEDLPKPTLIEDLGYLYPNENSIQKRHYGLYECSLCGKGFRTQVFKVTTKHTVSCGCYKSSKLSNRNKTHGLSNIRLNRIWRNLKNRILNPKFKQYSDYGGRGITICDEWKNDFMLFYNWAMANGYSEELSIDRIDNSRDYSPENCRWTTQTIQNRNQRIRKDNTSGYRGVNFHRREKNFKVRISVNKKRIYLGSFSTAVEGAIAYNNYIIENDLEGFILNEIPASHIHLQFPTKPHHQTLE